MKLYMGLAAITLVAACSKDATGPTSVPLTLEATDTAYAHGVAILSVVATPAQAGATVTLWAGDGTLALASPGHWFWTVDPQLPTHALYGCAITSGACSAPRDTLKLSQLPHDPSVLITSSVTAGYIEVFWRTATDSADTVLSSPIPQPGVCYRFTTPPGDSAQWSITANDSAYNASAVSKTWSVVWWGTDSLPAWALNVQPGTGSTPIIQLQPSGSPC